MRITDVRIKLATEGMRANQRLLAFAAIEIDGVFVIRDLKFIEGDGGAFVGFPSRKLTDHCGNCGTKNHLLAKFCSECGCRLDENRATRGVEGKAKLYADVAHPICREGRALIHDAIAEAYARELLRAAKPGYVSRYHDIDAEYDEADADVARVA